MTYQVTHTDSTNPLKPPYKVQDGTLNNDTSLQFVGRGYTGFAPIVANDFLHLLENFAYSSPPNNPIEGQIWYDNSSGVNLLKVYDGTNWNEAGSIKKAATAPEVSNSVQGDVWVNTATSQLYLFSGSSWLLVGPQFSEGLKTGPVVEIYVDTRNISHSVLSFYAASVSDLTDHIIAIVSKDSFIPKTPIIGFPSISQGINLSTVGALNASNPTRFNGTATSADALLVSNTAIPAANFLRSDTASLTNYPLSVRHDGGISIGANLGFNIAIGSGVTSFLSNNSGSNVNFTLNNSGTLTTVLHVDSGAKVGIGSNNTSPLTTLDVAGVITTSGITSGLTVQGTTDSTSVGTGSIKTSGGLSVALNSNFGGNISTYSQILVNNLDSNGTPIATSVILPGTSSANQTYDIGSSARQFRNVYAQTFNGSFNGSFTGSLNGSVSGTAAALASPTVFSITGDVTSNNLSFNGQTSGGTAVFTTTINESLISNKTAATDSYATDSLLVYRSNTGLVSMTKSVFLNHVATMPIGTIIPYAGSVLPTTGGYLFCDGSEVQISAYPALYNIIKYAYKASSLLQGLNTFALPDLRGRFPLGADNMNNNITVPSKDGSGTLISTGGGAANRVTDVTADNVGTGSGSQSVTVSNSKSASPAGTNLYDLSAQSFNIMNPYQTINYIIFTGVL